MSNPVYIIGIDLGTTNSVVAYTKANIQKGEKPDIKILEIPQTVGAGIIEKRETLPSFMLIPGKHDVPKDALCLPWDKDNKIAVGEFARDRGAEIPHRLISSSKSWLCHTLIDRNKPILPWECNDEQSKLSPVEAASIILKHIRNAWNATIANNDEKLNMERQDILLTVPASFDAVARDLTLKAASMAGLSTVTMLEEPQAAFYAWIESAGDEWRKSVKQGDLILVCDVGGGTSDFSLISILEKDGELVLERIAVGDHLLVGGDNMDITLAYFVSKQLTSKVSKLDTWQMRSLCHSCRNAKEKILSDDDCGEYPITVLGRGSSLIGGTIKTNLLRKDMEKVILNGFFPHCKISSKSSSKQKTGIRELGLSYETDPAVTHHIAQFISRQKNKNDKGKINMPSAALFNGGAMKPDLIRKRILDIISSWDGKSKSPSIREIKNKDFDLSVARGAVYYGMARRGNGVRIHGGLGRSYYIGVAASMPAVPGMPAPMKALCVAPFGMEEGSMTALDGQEFILVVGEPVKFDFLCSSVRYDDKAGDVIEDWEEEIEELTTIETTLDGEHGSVIPVAIEIKVTEVGALEFWCVEKDGSRKWKLEFNVREKKNLTDLDAK